MIARRATTFILMGMLFILNSNSKEIKLEQLQVAFIYKFTNYIEWPQQTGNSFEIGVLNNQEVYLAMKDIFDGKFVEKSPVIVTNVSKIDKDKRYNILFVSKINSSNADEIRSLSTNGLLVISQNDDGLQENVLINFYIDDEKKLRFEIDQEKSSLHGLKINSRLLHLSKRSK